MSESKRIALGNDEAAVTLRTLLAEHLRARGLAVDLICGPEVARAIVDAWLAAEFEGGRSAPKVAKLAELDQLRLPSTSEAVSGRG